MLSDSILPTDDLLSNRRQPGRGKRSRKVGFEEFKTALKRRATRAGSGGVLHKGGEGWWVCLPLNIVRGARERERERFG